METNLLSTKKNAGNRTYGNVRQLIVLVIFLFGFGTTALFSQTQMEYRYRFGLQGITDGAGAKAVVDILRPLFNTPDAEFETFPEFNEQTDEFDFFSPVIVSREQLEMALTPHNISVITFSRSEAVQPKNEGQ
jgi:hypothetical protein